MTLNKDSEKLMQYYPTSLLSHLAIKAIRRPEFLATEALAYILCEWELARNVIRHLLMELAQVDIGHPLHYETQKADEEGSLPDIRARDVNQAARLLLEAKLSAGLTAAQPVSYLSNLPAGGVLLFVVPPRRQVVLWKELLRRVDAAGLHVETVNEETRVRWAKVGGKTLALTSWDTISFHLKFAARDKDNGRMLEAVNQLSALCLQMKSEEFIPLSEEELTASHWKRLVQVGNLTESLAWSLHAENLLTMKPNKGSSNGAFGLYVQVKGQTGYIHVDATKWSDFGAPLWISFPGLQGVAHPQTRLALQAAGIPHKMHQDALHVSLPVDAGKDQHELESACKTFLLDLVEKLPVIAKADATLTGDAPSDTTNEEDEDGTLQ